MSRTAIATAAALLAISLAACSANAESTSSAPTADAAALGTENAATGTPIKIGFIGDGKSEILDATDELKGAQTAVDYANAYLGGIDGHKIDLQVCSTKLTPAGSTDCANQMVQADVAAVVEGISVTVDAAIDTLAAAKIPMFLQGGSTQKSLMTPGVYSFFNGLSTFGVAALQAKDANVDKTAIVTVAVPAAEGAARGVGALVFGNVGVGIDVIPVPAGTADTTPQITTAVNDGAKAFMVLGTDAFCVSTLKAIRTLAPDALITIPDRCITEGSSASIPNGYDGMNVTTSGSFDPSTPDAKLFSAALAEYGDGASFTALSGYGWQPTLALIQALNETKTTDLTPAGILAAVQTAPALPYPLAAGVTFQCNGTQVPVSPFLCGSDGLVATAAQDGSLSDFRKVSIDPKIFTPPGS